MDMLWLRIPHDAVCLWIFEWGGYFVLGYNIVEPEYKDAYAEWIFKCDTVK